VPLVVLVRGSRALGGVAGEEFPDLLLETAYFAREL
jgi:hypothetical protein